MTIRDIAIAFGYEIDKASESKVEQGIQKLKSTATKLLGAIGVGFSLTQINQLMEEFDAYNDRIQNATKSLGDQKEIQQQILDAANATKSSYGDMGKIISNLVQNDKSLFGSVDEAAEFATLSTKLFKTAGKSNEEIASLQEAINKSFAKGIVDSETINQLYERAPEAINMIADSLGVAKEELASMATEGTMSLADLKNAFIQNADTINAEFENLNYSISDAILNIRNKWGLFLDGLNKSLGITQTIGKIMVRSFDMVLNVLKRLQTWLERVSKAVGGFENLLKILAITAGAVFIAMNAGKIMTFLKGATGLLSKANLKLLAIIAVIVLLALLVEDFIKFMKGENSLMGSLLEKAGVDTNALRERFGKLFDSVKEIIPVIKDFARQVGSTVLSALKRLIPYIAQIAKALLPFILNLLETIIPFLIQIGEAVIPVILNLLKTLIPFLLQIIESILPVIIELINTLLPIIMQIVEAVLPVILSLIEAILPLLTQIIEAVLPVVLELLNAILPILEPIFTIISDLVNAILPLVVSLLNAILPILEPILAILKPIADILGVIIGAIAKVVGWIADGLGWIVNLIFGGGDGPDTSGADAVNGYASGTESTPDTFIAGEEGPELITGARGRKVFTALQTGDIFNALGALGGAGKVQPSTVATTTSSTKIINQTNNINNNFNGGDRAAQKQGAAAMEKSASDATSQMARGLAYAR